MAKNAGVPCVISYQPTRWATDQSMVFFWPVFSDNPYVSLSPFSRGHKPCPDLTNVSDTDSETDTA